MDPPHKRWGGLGSGFRLLWCRCMPAMPTGGARGFLAGPEPAVIDEELCRKCITTVRTRPAQAGEAPVAETKKEAQAFKDVKALVRSPCPRS